MQKLFLRKAVVSWKSTGASPAGLIHMCIVFQKKTTCQHSDLDLLFWYINPLKIAIFGIGKETQSLFLDSGIHIFPFLKKQLHV